MHGTNIRIPKKIWLIFVHLEIWKYETVNPLDKSSDELSTIGLWVIMTDENWAFFKNGEVKAGDAWKFRGPEENLQGEYDPNSTRNIPELWDQF